MKKIAVIMLILSLVGAGSAFAAGPLGLTGFGVYGTLGSTAGKLGGGVGLSLKWASFPVVGLQYNLTAERINASVDYYIIDAEGLAANLSYFLGAGLYAGIGTGGGEAQVDFGFRIPVGLQFWPIRKFELFFAPVLAIAVIPEPELGLGAEFGARVRF